MDEDFKESIQDSVAITISLGNGDSWEGEKLDRLIASRMFVRFTQGRSWVAREDARVSDDSFGSFEVYKCIGRSIKKAHGWRAVFIMVDDCQFISTNRNDLRSFTHIICRLMTECIPNTSTSVTAYYNTYIVPILAGTLTQEQVQFFADMSDFTTQAIQMPLLSAENALSICSRTIKDHPALQVPKVQLLIKQYGAIPRMLEGMVTVLRAYPSETRPQILEGAFETEFSNAYKVSPSIHKVINNESSRTKL